MVGLGLFHQGYLDLLLSMAFHLDALLLDIIGHHGEHQVGVNQIPNLPLRHLKCGDGRCSQTVLVLLTWSRAWAGDARKLYDKFGKI